MGYCLWGEGGHLIKLTHHQTSSRTIYEAMKMYLPEMGDITTAVID